MEKTKRAAHLHPQLVNCPTQAKSGLEWATGQAKSGLEWATGGWVGGDRQASRAGPMGESRGSAPQMTVGSNGEQPRLGDSFGECRLLQGQIGPIGLAVALPVLAGMLF